MDILSNPLSLIDRLYEQAGCPRTAEAGDWGAGDYIRRLLAEGLPVPLLSGASVDAIPQNGLCRFVGLVQDMLDPECYLGAFEQQDGCWRTTRFRDFVTTEAVHNTPHTLCDRRPVYCMRPPGESAWTRESQPEAATSDLSSQATKRARPEDGECDMQQGQAQQGPGTCKAAKLGSMRQEKLSSKPTQPEAEDGDCIVYLYGADEGFKVNDVVEIAGVLSRVPELGAFPEGSEVSAEDADIMEYDSPSLLPTSQVPRVHALLARKATAQDRAGALVIKGPSELRMRATELRQQAMSLLSCALGGDSLAAEYSLLQLLSRVHTRAGEQVLGGLSLNLTLSSSIQQQTCLADGSASQISATGRALHTAIATLIPYSKVMPVGPSQLNAARFIPRQDHTGRRLVKGGLQLAEGTHLLLDETHMRPGQLNANGIANLQALRGVLETKQVDYDFEFYKLSMPLDVPITILSQGKALLQGSVDVVLPLQSTSSAGSDASLAAVCSNMDLSGARSYLSHMRGADFTLEPGSSKWLEDGIVAASRSSGAQRDEKMARLLALSHGETTLSKERWDQMRSMEHRRAERIRVQPTRMQAA